MYRATRDFIEARQKFCKWRLDVVRVQNMGGGVPNSCYTNARSSADKARGIWFVAGWIVMPYNATTNSTEIIQHWWNATANNEHFDTTPCLAMTGGEYVQDRSYFNYCCDNDPLLNSHVSSSLLLKAGSFWAVDEKPDMSLEYRAISDLSCEELFRTKMLSFKQAA